MPHDDVTIPAPVRARITEINASDRVPVMFIHGLWLLPSSWQRWAAVFEEAGYAPLLPGWPDDPDTVAEANAHPEVFAHKSVGRVAGHFAAVASALTHRPVVVGHSFGGLITEIVAGRGCASASVVIDGAPFRGVLPVPTSALRSSAPVLGNPANYGRAVSLTYAQWRYAFANAVDEQQARRLYDAYAVPASGMPIFQAASANVNPWTQVKVDTENVERGPMLMLTGEKDHVVPRAISAAAFKRQQRNVSVTELVEVPDRGHALTIDDGWREVAQLALGFAQRFAPTPARHASDRAARSVG